MEKIPHKFERLNRQFLSLLGKECIIHIECNGRTNEAYLPEGWKEGMELSVMRYFIQQLKVKYGTLEDIGIIVISIDDFIRLVENKEKAVETVQKLRDIYIHEYMNNEG